MFSRIEPSAFPRATSIICRYDLELNASLSKAVKISTVDEAKDMSGDVNIQYSSQEHYETLTERLGILREWKVTAYPIYTPQAYVQPTFNYIALNCATLILL